MCIHPTKFGGRMHYDSGDKTFLIRYMILPDYAIERSYDFMDENPSR